MKVIQNSKVKIQKSKGFTLVELLAVMLVFSVVGSIAGAILVSSLRTANKSNTVSTMKQNGDFALTQMAKTIRYAKQLRSPYPCVYISPTPSPLPVSSISITLPDNTPVTYTCNGSSNGQTTIASGAADSTNALPLLDATAVRLVSCTFTCSQQSKSDYPLIGISFSLAQINVNAAAEQRASISFSTSVLMKNINR